MKALWILVAVVCTSCTIALTPAGEKVRVTSNPDVVKGCDFIGPVEGSSSYGGMAMQRVGEHNSINELRNEAGKLGADTVMLVTSHVGFSGAKQRGEAYNCHTANKT